MKKTIVFILILISVSLLTSCGGEETEPVTELYFDTLIELGNYLTSDNVKIIDPNLTEEQVIEKYEFDMQNLTGDMMKYFRNYVYSDIVSLNTHITDSCYKMEMSENNVPKNNIQGLPQLIFFYEVSDISGLKGIVIEILPISTQNLPSELNQPFTLVSDYISHTRFDWGKSIQGYEPKSFVINIDLSPTVENGKIVNHGYDVVFSNGLYDVYYIYEIGYERTQVNTEFENTINSLFQEHTILVEIN